MQGVTRIVNEYEDFYSPPFKTWERSPTALHLTGLLLDCHMAFGTRISILAVVVAFALPALAEQDPKRVDMFAIPQESGALILDMANPAPKTFPGGWKLDGVSIQYGTAELTYLSKGNKELKLKLVHPSMDAKPLAKTGKFAISNPALANKAPKAVVEALASRIMASESRFEWVVQTTRAATPIHRLNRIPLSFKDEKDRVAFEKAFGDVRGDGKAGALAWAEKVVKERADDKPLLRAAADIFRRGGRAGRANEILGPMVDKAGDDLDWNMVVELAASLEMTGSDAGVDVLKKAMKQLPDFATDIRCARTEAMTLAMSEGDVNAMAKRAGEGPSEARLALSATDSGTPLCVYLFLIKSAGAVDDEKTLDATAEAALKRFPEDPDVLFLWGTHYYMADKCARAVPIWDRLAAIDPGYPTFLGQYGTAWLVADLLTWDAINAFEKKAKETGDVVAHYLAGIGLYYKYSYDRVIEHLEVAARAITHEPRAAMYLAMARAFTGKRDSALGVMESLESQAYREPDIYYCRSLLYRKTDLNRAILEMEKFLEVFEGEGRLRFGQQKVDKAIRDLKEMREGKVPPIHLPLPDGSIPADPF